MPKKKRRCQHEKFGGEPCPHEYFVTWADPETGDEKDYCIFHAPIESKEDKTDEFWESFRAYFYKTLEEFDTSKTEKERENIWLDCVDFVFPVTDDTFKRLEIPFAVYFNGCRFASNSVFERTRFKGATFFSGSVFKGETCFTQTFFLGDAYFDYVYFEGRTSFAGVIFKKTAEFYYTILLSDEAYLGFFNTEFGSRANFMNINIIPTDNNKTPPPSVNFCGCHFYEPARTLIGKGSDLTRWSFSGTNLESINFVKPKWANYSRRCILNSLGFNRYKRRLTITKDHASIKRWLYPRGKKVVYDEILAFNDDPLVSWSDAEAVYRSLRSNYETRLAYEAAGDFHYGQMECRLRDPTRPLWDKAPTFVYKVISGYGESFIRPLLWLGFTIIGFAGLFLITGIPAGKGHTIEWDLCYPWEIFASGFVRWFVELGKGILYSLNTVVSQGLPAGFTDIMPFYTNAERIFGIALIAMFIDAIRKFFRRFG